MIPRIRTARRTPTIVGYEYVGGLVEIDGKLFQAQKAESNGFGPSVILERVHGLGMSVGEENYLCVSCGSYDTLTEEIVPSFGGTTEGSEHCSDCGATWGWLDDSAVR